MMNIWRLAGFSDTIYGNARNVTEMTTKDAVRGFADAVNHVAFGHERVVLTRRQPARLTSTYTAGNRIARPSWSVDGRSLLVLGSSALPERQGRSPLIDREGRSPRPPGRATSTPARRQFRCRAHHPRSSSR